MPRIGITYRVSQPVYGATQTALALAMSASGHEVVLIDTSNSNGGEAHGYPVVNLFEATGLDLLVDIDGLVSAYDRGRCAARCVMFLRESLAFTEMDASVYIETDYARRSFEGVAEAWCWDVLNSEESLAALRVMFPCPLRRVPFVWTAALMPEGGVPWTRRADVAWSVHIAERNLENTSSCVLPLVIARHLHTTGFPAIFTVHNMGRIKDHKFLKENILDNIEAERIHVRLDAEEWKLSDWTEDNAVVLSHARFTPLALWLLDALWCGLPVVHNSEVLRGLHPALEGSWYHGNTIERGVAGERGAAAAFRSLSTWPAAEIRNAVEAFGRQGVDAWQGVWSSAAGTKSAAGAENGVRSAAVNAVSSAAVSATKASSAAPPMEGAFRIAFADMWPGFNPHTNFFMDALRHFGYTVEHAQEGANLLIFGPYGETWREVTGIPRVYFSAENWAKVDEEAERADLLLTSRPAEDERHMRIPTWMTFVDWFSGAETLPSDTLDNPIRLPVWFATHTHPKGWAERSKFCAFVVSNPTCSVRNAVFEAVHGWKAVSSGGGLYNNIGGPLALRYPGGGGGDLSKHAFFADHRFTLSFENSQARGYVTEKLLHAKMAGCVPIYWGDAAATDEFAPNSFVNVSGTSDVGAILEVVKRLESAPSELLGRMAATPLLDAERVARAVEVQRTMCARLAGLGGLKAFKPTSVGDLKAPVSQGGLKGNAAGAGLDGVAHTFVINLDHRRDRWDGLMAAEPYLAEWERAGTLERFSAVNGKTMEMTEFVYGLFEKNEFQWKKSVVGCNMSHIRVWDRIASSAHEGWHLVLEDDVRFVEGWRDVWSQAIREVPAEAELLYLGGVLPPNKAALPQASEADGAHWAHVIPNTFFSPTPLAVFHFCAYSYLLTRRGARKILDYLLDSEKKSFTVSDHLLGHPLVGLRKFFTRPLLSYCFQESDPVYVQSAFNDLHREDTFDSDIWNNKECFTEAELAPFRLRRSRGALEVFYCGDPLKAGGDGVGADEKGAGLYERAWLEDVFGLPLRLRSLQNVELSHHTWFLVQRPYVAHLAELFGRMEKARIPFHVIHLSDEFGTDDLAWYGLEMCQSVIRNYPRAMPAGVEGKVHVIPLGYHHRPTSAVKPWKDRELVWSFHGTDWFDRSQQLQALTSYVPYSCHLQPHWNHPTATKERMYLSLLGNSRFCPILKGQHAETFRMYEALEAGTLPVTLMREGCEEWLAWIEENLGLSEIYGWTDAAVMGQALSEEIRMRVVAKWEAWKARVRTVCRGLLC